jgi:hypothetical protein
MTGATPEEMRQTYKATPDEVHQAIKDWMFDEGIMVVNESDGSIRGESENASVGVNVALGTSHRFFTNFQYRGDEGEYTVLQASFISAGGGSRMDVSADVYRRVFAEIGDYIDASQE